MMVSSETGVLPFDWYAGAQVECWIHWYGLSIVQCLHVLHQLGYVVTLDMVLQSLWTRGYNVTY